MIFCQKITKFCSKLLKLNLLRALSFKNSLVFAHFFVVSRSPVFLLVVCTSLNLHYSPLMDSITGVPLFYSHILWLFSFFRHCFGIHEQTQLKLEIAAKDVLNE